MDVSQHAPPPRRSRLWLWISLAFLLTVAGASPWWFFNPLKAPVPEAYRVLVDGSPLDTPVLVQDDKVFLPIETIRKTLDPALDWNPETGLAIVTTNDRVVRMKTDLLTALVNERPVDLQVPPKTVQGTVFLPMDFLAPIYDVNVGLYPTAKSVTVQRRSIPVLSAEVKRNGAALRQQSSQRARIVARLDGGETVQVYTEQDNWLFISDGSGWYGYLRESDVALLEPQVRTAPSPPAPPVWKPVGGRVSLVWEQVEKRTPDMTGRSFPGLNVVSPTWFHLTDDAGNLENRADPTYVDWAHRQGYQVWGLVTNSFDPERTHRVLIDPEKRRKVIIQLLLFAEISRLDGINLDFENMFLSDKALYVQFVRELTPLAHEQGLVVSVDVTVKSMSENYSLVYDRRSLAQTVDYVMLMAYDEHWATSPVAGPVASLPWVDRGLRGVLDDVPAEKLILGMPFYTRVWEEVPLSGNKVKVSSRALSMEAADRLLKDADVTPVEDRESGLAYATYTHGSSTFKIWLEDENSITSRLELVRRYNLAGIAAWRRGFETPAIWPLIEQSLNSFPVPGQVHER